MENTCLHSVVTDLPVIHSKKVPESKSWEPIKDFTKSAMPTLEEAQRGDVADHTKVAVVNAILKAPMSPGFVRDVFPQGRLLHRHHGSGTIADSSMRIHQGEGCILVVFDSGHIAKFPESKWHLLHPLESSDAKSKRKNARKKKVQDALATMAAARKAPTEEEIQIHNFIENEQAEQVEEMEQNEFDGQGSTQHPSRLDEETNVSFLWNEEERRTDDALDALANAGTEASKAAKLVRRLREFDHIR